MERRRNCGGRRNRSARSFAADGGGDPPIRRAFTALLIDSAVRAVKGQIEDTEAVRKALKAAKFQSVRGAFKLNRNQYPIQNYYLRVVGKDSQGR